MALICVWWWGSSSEDLESVEYSFIAMTPSSSLTRNDRIYCGPIYVLNRTVLKSFVLDRNTWYHITVNYLYEELLLEDIVYKGLLLLYVLSIWEFFKPAFTNDFLLESKWYQVSSSLHDSS